MADSLSFTRQVAAIAAVSFGTALVVIDGNIVSVALPTIAQDLHVSASMSVLVVTVYQLILVMTLLSFSNLGDRIGHRTQYQIGQLVFLFATICCFAARNLPLLLLARALQALGAAAALSVTQALIRAVYPRQQLGRGLGINAIVVQSASALAPTAGGLVLSFASWPWIFAAAIPFGCLSLALGRALPEPVFIDRPFDILGASLCALTLGLIIAGLETAVHGGAFFTSIGVIGIGILIGVFFVRRELHAQYPIMPIDLLEQPVIALSVLGAMCAFIAAMSLTLSLPFRLQHVYGFSPGQVGAMIAPWPLATMIAAPIAGVLSDRYPAGVLGGIGMGMSAISLASFVFLPAHPHYYDFVWRMVLCGAGFGIFISPNIRLIVGSAPAERAASAGGMSATARLVGQTLGATLVAAMLATGLGNGSAPSLAAAGLAAVAALCSLARLRPSLQSRPKAQ